jgi:hypothetical protein
MIPDFPVLKEELNRAITCFMRERFKFHRGPLSDVPQGRVFEGRRNVIVRPDGSEDETKMREISAETRFAADDMRELHLPKLLEKLDAMVQEMAATQARHFYETMSEGVQKVGNTVDGGGQRFTAELFLQAMEKILIDFNADGSPEMPTVHISPNQTDDVKRMIERFESEPDLKKRFDTIMTKKREEWRAREADRKLVG